MDEAQRKLVWEAMLDADLLGRALLAEMKRQERLNRRLALVSAVAGTAAFAAIVAQFQTALPSEARAWVALIVGLVVMFSTQVNAVWAYRDTAREIAGVVESCSTLEGSWELIWTDMNAHKDDVEQRLRDVFAQWQSVKARAQKYLPPRDALMRAQNEVFAARGLPSLQA